MIKFFAGLTACFVVLCAGYAIASRNSSGTYSIPNTFTSGSVISSSAVNANFSDIGTELTSSLDRAGRGAMTAQLQLASGTVATPGLGFSSDTGSGLYRIGSADIGFAISGTKKLELTSSLFTVVPNLSLSGYISSNLGVGVAPSRLFHVYSGSSGATSSAFTTSLFESSTSVLLSLLSPNAGNAAFCFGDVANSCRGAIQYFNSTHASADQMQFTTGGTVRATLSNTGLTINTGVAPDGSGLKHQSVAGCATAAAIGATCTSTLTWTTTFANASYQAVCSCNAVTSGLPIIRSYTNSGDGISITLTTMAMTAAAAQCTVITCMAAHD